MTNPFNRFINSLLAKQPEQSAFDPKLVRAYNKTRLSKDYSSFCFAPSINMLFAQDGQVFACCHNKEYALGRWPEQTISEIWNSEAAKALRASLRKYDLSKGCSICAEDMNPNGFEEVRARHFDTLPIHQEYPTMMEFLLTNTCNLECVMCQGEFSSLIRKNREKLPPIHSPYNQEFLKQLEEFIPYLRETRFSGSGEAFSIDMNYDIWEMIIARNPKCLIMVQTNGTILTGRVKEIMAKGNFQIGVSLDSLQKETYEGIRLNANFNKVMDNIRYFNQYCLDKNIKFSIATCIMRNNWRELPDFINFSNSLNAVATFHKVWWPEEYALFNLTASELKEIYDYLSGHSFPTDTHRQQLNQHHYNYFVAVVKDWYDKNHAEEQKYLQQLNTINQLDFSGLSLYIEQKLSDALCNEEAQQQMLQQYLGKLTELLNLYDESIRETALRNICAAPVNELLYALQEHSLEYLYQQGQQYLGIETVS